MKSHSLKAPRKSFDVTKMSGPEIAAEMSRQMTEFKSARKHPDPAITRKEIGPTETHSKQSGNHPFLRASLAAGAGSATAPSSLRDRELQLDKPLVLGTERGSSGLAFLRHGARNERSQSIAERRSPQYPRERSYRAGLLAGASLVLVLIGVASAALWKSGTLPDFVGRSLQDTLRSATETRSEPAPGPIASRDVVAESSPAAVDQPAPIPPTPIVLMIAPAPAAISNPTLTVDTRSAVAALQLDAPAIDIDDDDFQSFMSDHGGTEAAAPLREETGAGLSADSPATSSTSEVLKRLAVRPRLKPALDVEAPAEPETTTAVPIRIDTATDEQPEVPFVAGIAKPFVPQRMSSAAQDPEAPHPEYSPAHTLSPLPPPIVIRSIGKVSNTPGAASIEISEQPAKGDQRAASSLDNRGSHGRRDPNSETDAGRDGGMGVADAEPDRPSASGRDHGGSPSAGDGGGGGSGTDPGDGTSGSGGTGGSTGGDGGSGGNDGGTGGGGDGDSDGGSDGGSSGGDGGDGGDGGGDSGGDGGSDGGDGGGDSGGDGGSDGGDGGGDSGGDGGSDGGSGGDDGGDGGGDGGGDTGDGDGGGLGGGLGGLGGALGGALGGN